MPDYDPDTKPEYTPDSVPNYDPDTKPEYTLDSVPDYDPDYDPDYAAELDYDLDAAPEAAETTILHQIRNMSPSQTLFRNMDRRRTIPLPGLSLSTKHAALEEDLPRKSPGGWFF